MKEIPFSKSAEAGVLGSMLIDPAQIDNLMQVISEPENFYVKENRMIFEAIICIYTENLKGGQRGLDAILLRDELEKRKELEIVGGVKYIANILDSVPSSANILYYANILKEKKMLRDLIVTATNILNNAYDGAGEAKEKLDEAEREIFEITGKQIQGKIENLGTLIEQTYLAIADRETKYVTGIETGYYELDDMTCGLQNGEMIILAGRPSMGKTSLAMNIAENIGLKNKIPVGIVSLEMTKQNLAEKFLCSTSEVDQQGAKRGILGIKHFEKMLETAVEYSKAEIYIDDTASMTPLEFRAISRRMKRQYDIKCIILDYLQLMHLGRRTESRQQEITEISRYIKALAKELQIPVLVISQLNRSPEGRAGHRPKMSDLRESGSIEQDADVVMLMHRDDYYHRGEAEYIEDNRAEVIIAKQRNGPTGSVHLIFREQYTRFENESHN